MLWGGWELKQKFRFRRSKVLKSPYTSPASVRENCVLPRPRKPAQGSRATAFFLLTRAQLDCGE